MVEVSSLHRPEGELCPIVMSDPFAYYIRNTECFGTVSEAITPFGLCQSRTNALHLIQHRYLHYYYRGIIGLDKL